MPKFTENRPIAELIILFLVLTVCAVVIGSTVTISILEILNPANDTSQAAAMIANVLNTLVGVVIGFLAGRTEKRLE